MPTNPESKYNFSPRELQRLGVYRAAVVARFYNDDSDNGRRSRVLEEASEIVRTLDEPAKVPDPTSETLKPLTDEEIGKHIEPDFFS